MKKKEKKREILRSVRGIDFKGYMIKKGNEYRYEYKDIWYVVGRYMNAGDKRRIVEITGYSWQYVNDVLRGKRWNAYIVQLAMKIKNMIEELGNEKKIFANCEDGSDKEF